jgi:glycosyltransferase involved in cell wall biosynthesis
MQGLPPGSIKVGVGASVLANGLISNSLDGIGTYTNEIIKGLKSTPDVYPELYAFSGIQHPPTLPKIIHAGRFHWQVGTSLTIGRQFTELATNGQHLDVVHATDHLVPRLKSIPVVATLMDAIPLAHPEWVGYHFKTPINEAWRRTFSWATRIITISEFSKHEIVRWFKIPTERIDVIPLGVDLSWSEKPSEYATSKLRERLSLPHKFLLNIGTLQPRKNIERLLDAHERLTSDEQQAFPLLIVGRLGWGCENLVKRLHTSDPNRIRWLSRLDQHDLHIIMHLAHGFVFPSLYEGFGLPLLEAFASGTPVAAADSSALPEVSAGCAHLFDPEDVESMAHALGKLIHDSNANNQLISKGLRRAKHFTWEKTTKSTLASYLSAM